MVCTANYPSVLAFCFLDELQKEFIVTYDTKRISSAVRPYSFIEFGELHGVLQHVLANYLMGNLIVFVIQKPSASLFINNLGEKIHRKIRSCTNFSYKFSLMLTVAVCRLENLLIFPLSIHISIHSLFLYVLEKLNGTRYILLGSTKCSL